MFELQHAQLLSWIPTAPSQEPFENKMDLISGSLSEERLGKIYCIVYDHSWYNPEVEQKPKTCKTSTGTTELQW
jgi:hypothetical protein